MCTFAGANREAVAHVNRALQLGSPRNWVLAPGVLSWTAWRAGDVHRARDEMIRTLPDEVRSAGGAEAVTAVYAGLSDPTKRSAALAAIHERLAPVSGFDLARAVTSMHVIAWYTMFGALDAAYDVAWKYLERNVRHGLTGRFWHALWLPEIRAFRQDPRFQHLVKSLHLIEYWQAHGPPDGCDLRDGALLVY